MYKKESYSKRAISTIEIVSSYFVNIYYNCLYQEAKRLHIDSRVESVTNGYKHAIKAYINSFDNPDLYRKIVSGIHKYYHTTTRFTSISFSDCINEIVKHFIPEAFLDSTTNTQKDSILRVILLNSVKRFSSEVICSDMLTTIIDNHTDYGISRRMQDCMVQALMFEREKMFQKIFSTSTETQDGASFAMVTRLKQELVKVAREKYVVECKHNKIKTKALDLIKLTKEYQQNIASIEKEKETLKKQLEDFKRTTSTYQQEKEQLTAKQLEKENAHQNNRIKELERALLIFNEKEIQAREEKEARRRKKKERNRTNTADVFVRDIENNTTHDITNTIENNTSHVITNTIENNTTHDTEINDVIHDLEDSNEAINTVVSSNYKEQDDQFEDIFNDAQEIDKVGDSDFLGIDDF